MPGKYVKECGECELFEDYKDKVSTDATADWYVKGKHKNGLFHRKGTSICLMHSLIVSGGISQAATQVP